MFGHHIEYFKIYYGHIFGWASTANISIIPANGIGECECVYDLFVISFIYCLVFYQCFCLILDIQNGCALSRFFCDAVALSLSLPLPSPSLSYRLSLFPRPLFLSCACIGFRIFPIRFSGFCHHRLCIVSASKLHLVYSVGIYSIQMLSALNLFIC